MNQESRLRRGVQKGFSLIELLVSIAIFTAITALIMVNQSGFGGSVLITNLAYDVALGIRQAQVYGISVRRVSTVPEQAFDRSYGIHFDLQRQFVLFVDLDKDGRYDTTANDTKGCLPTANPECVNVFRIEQGNMITRFCAGADCAGAQANGGIDALDILFRRPEPEPIIHGIKDKVVIQDGGVPRVYTNSSVTVTSPQGMSRRVEVSSSGQISIK